VVPRIEFLQDYSEMLPKASPNALRLILWEREGMKLKEILERSKERKKIFFVIGPEEDSVRGRLKKEKNRVYPCDIGKEDIKG